MTHTMTDTASHLLPQLPPDDAADVEAAPAFCPLCGERQGPDGPCAQCAENASTPWVCDPESCAGCPRCYQRLGDSRCAQNCHHGLVAFARETAAGLRAGWTLDGEEIPQLLHTLDRLCAIVEAADALREAENTAWAWRHAVDVERKAAIEALVPAAHRTLARVMDGA
jgi:hypothetical protein